MVPRGVLHFLSALAFAPLPRALAPAGDGRAQLVGSLSLSDEVQVCRVSQRRRAASWAASLTAVSLNRCGASRGRVGQAGARLRSGTGPGMPRATIRMGAGGGGGGPMCCGGSGEWPFMPLQAPGGGMPWPG